MLIDINTAAVVVVLVVGMLGYMANYRRRINQLFAVLSIWAIAWIAARKLATESADAVFWVRITNSFGGIFPLIFSHIKEAVSNEKKEGVASGFSWASWLLAGFLFAVPFTSWFIPSESTPSAPKWGVGYYAYSLLTGAWFFRLFSKTLIEARKSQGVVRLELQ